MTNIWPGLCILFLLILFAALSATWPPYRYAVVGSFHALTHPWLKIFASEQTIKKVDLPEGKPSAQARSIEFRVQQYDVTPSLIEAWCAEWRCGSLQRNLILRLLLHQLPEMTARENDRTQRQDLIQSILSLTSEGRKEQPENGFYRLTEALAFFYAGQDTAAMASLKQIGNSRLMSAGLKELNDSENVLSQATLQPWILLPPTHRIWELQIERPLSVWSRAIALQERTLLQKYNIERALELGLLHLELGMRISEMAWTPFDQAVAQSIINRALEPFWNQKNMTLTPDQLEENFISFLEDQGDKLNAAKIRAWHSTLTARENVGAYMLSKWRHIQLLSRWNASSILASLFLQIISAIFVFGTLIFASIPPGNFSASDHSSESLNPIRSGLAAFAFVLGPIGWTILGWPIGGISQFVGLLGGWALWWGVITFTNPRPSMSTLKTSLAYSILTLLTVTVLTTVAIAEAIQYQQKYLHIIADHGWFS